MNLHAVGPTPSAAEAVWTRPARTRHRLIGIGILIALAAAGALYYVLNGAKPVPPIAKEASALSVTIEPAIVTTMTRSLSVTGSLSAVDELPVGTETAGLAIRDVLVEEGDEVKAGQVIARFDDEVAKADVQQKEAALREAEANAAEADANIKRAEDLFRTNAVSAREVDNRRATATTATARVAVAKANLVEANVHLSQTELRAPTDGRIMMRMARVGAVPPAGTELFRILRDDRVQLAADVPETELARIRPGLPVRLILDGDLAGRDFEGRVRLVSPVVDSKTRFGTVKIDVPRDPQLRPGMFARGRIVLGSLETVAVPDSAVVYKDAKPMLFVALGRTKAEARQIETGARENGMISILSNLKAGEPVVTAGAGYLKDGDAINVVPAAAADTIKPLPKTD